MGWEIKEINQDDELPDSVFVEDGVIFVGGTDKDSTKGIFIIASPGNAAREGEIVEIEASLRKSSTSHHIARIEKPATLDGGDVLKVPSSKTIFIGQSQRTNEEGIRQFTSLVTPLGWQVKPVPVKKALHLSAF
jgi:dimethylargininase